MDYLHYQGQEKEDATLLEEATELLDAGHREEAREMLQKIVSRTPEFYVYSFETDSEIYIKFWNLAEYLSYIAMVRDAAAPVEQEVLWLKSAYPPAYYYLAKIEIAKEEYASAAEYLDRVLHLEPDQPESLLEMGRICEQSEELEQALNYYDTALQSRPYMTGQTMVNLLKQKAQLLSDLGEEKEAKEVLALSLQYDGRAGMVDNREAYATSYQSGEHQAPFNLHLGEQSVGLDEPIFELLSGDAIGQKELSDQDEHDSHVDAVVANNRPSDECKDPCQDAVEGDFVDSLRESSGVNSGAEVKTMGSHKRWWQFWKSKK